MSNTTYKTNGRTRTTKKQTNKQTKKKTKQKRERAIFPRGQWCVFRSSGCSAVVPLSLCDLLDSRWCVSLAVFEEASIKPGQCQRQKHDDMLVFLRDGPAQTIVQAATLRQKLQITLSTSPSHSILTPG